MLEVRNVIGSGAVETDGPVLELTNPTTGEVFGSAPISGIDALNEAYDAAGLAYQVWRNETPAVRQLALLRIADLVEAHADELVQLESLNTGKPIAVTTTEEIPPMVDQLRFFAGAARVLEGRAAGEYSTGLTSMIRREPVGVIGQVTPWNYPLMMAVWKFAPAIAAGNTVVLKPAETTPCSTVRLAELICEADILPPGVLNVVCGDRSTGRLLAEHPGADMIAITGSVDAGIAVATAAAGQVKRTHLELGGKAPVVVFEDADPQRAAAWLAIAAFFNAGQDCTAAARVLVHERIHDEFVAALQTQCHAVKSTYTNGPIDPKALVPPLISEGQLNRVLGFLDRKPAHAEILAGGTRPGDRGFFVDPTLVVNLRQEDELVQKEIFGPVMTVQSFTDELAALHMANGVDYGLASSVWTTDHARAMRMAKALNFGTVWINTHIPLVAEMPHGGFKRSGYGKDLSMYGFEDYTRIKHVMSSLE